VIFFNNTPSLFVGQLFYSRGDREGMLPILRVFCTVCSDCMVLLLSLPKSTTWSLLGCLCPLLSSRLLWLSRCPPCGRVELLSLCCDVVCGFLRGIDGAKRQSMTSVGEVTAEEGRGRKCLLCAQPGIEPANSRLRDEYGTTRPLPAHCASGCTPPHNKTKSFS
jgi:hypothetical protein